ncbi:hypothetical protein MMF16_00008470 [Enterobacter hormaechei]
MSLNHSFLIGSDESSELMLNISGLDANAKEVDSLCANFFAHCAKTGTPKFTCKLTIQNLQNLYSHLSSYSMVCDSTSSKTGRFIEVRDNYNEIISILEHADNNSLVMALQHLVSSKLTNNDINTILGRKESLETYEKMLTEPDSYKEADWQRFFETNEWIFGYGLKYKFLKILQRELTYQELI